MYNLTEVIGANTLYGQTVAINDVSGGLIGIFILFSAFLVLFGSMKKYEEDTVPTALACFMITSVIAVMMWSVGMLAWHIIIYPIIGIFATFIILQLRD